MPSWMPPTTPWSTMPGMSFRLAPTMAHSIDQHGRITEVTEVWLERLGYAWDDVIGRPSTDFLSEQSARYASEVVLPMFFRTGVCDVEYEMRHKDGSLVPVRLRGVALRGDNGEFVRSIAVVEDLTEKRALEQKMLAAQKLESLGRMAGNIAHDFNNLIASIMGSAQLAQRHAGHSPIATKALDHIMLAATRAADLCRQLLAYSGRGRFQVEVIDLDGLVTEMSRVLAVNVGHKVRIELDLGRAGTRVEVDATEIRQILMNLVINAGQAIGDTPGTIRLRTSVAELDAAAIANSTNPSAQPGTYVVLEVSDDGPGMPPDVLANIFDPFFTTKPTGHGLGLAAVHGIVRGHRGTLRVTSEVGRGTQFLVYLPVAAPRACAAGAPTSARGTIAIVDDDDLLRETLASQLVDAGFDVVIAKTAHEARGLACPDGPKTFLLDITLPDVESPKLVSELRERDPDVRIVLMSGYSGVDMPPGENLRFLRKPFSEQELLRAIERAR
jgi:two-component system cell cycle sensor histidine kinase/response regulator CckA